MSTVNLQTDPIAARDTFQTGNGTAGFACQIADLGK